MHFYYTGKKYHETYFLPYQMFSTVKRCIHTKFGWIWSSAQSVRNKFSFKSVENWNFAGLQKASKKAETNDVLNRSESLTSWELKFFWIFKIGHFLVFKQLTSNLYNSHKFDDYIQVPYSRDKKAPKFEIDYEKECL